MYVSYRPLLDTLISRGVDPGTIEDAEREAERSGRTIRDILINDLVVTELELTEASAECHGMRSVDLVGYPIDQQAVTTIPLTLVLKHRLVGIGFEDGALVTAISDPDDVVALDDIRAATGLAIRPVVAARSELRKIIDRRKRDESDLSDVSDGFITGEDNAQSASLQDASGDGPIVHYVNSLIEQAIQSRASDLHLEPTEGEMRVRSRIDGVLHQVDLVPHHVQGALVSRLKIMAGVDITERRVPQNGRITVRLNNRDIDLRLATLPTVWGEEVILRVLDTGRVDLELGKLGFSDQNRKTFATAYRKPHGMVLVTGPTGSGKSTTLYATLGEISRPEVNVITVEDPVEYRIDGIKQVQVNAKAGLTFAAVLPAILRSDPDVVLIGEIRDRTTAQFAVEAALTGHLVLSTLHTNDAPSAVTRLVEMGIEPFLVGSSMACVLAQRLARRLCDWCKEAFEPTPADFDVVDWPLEYLPRPTTLWRAVGCRNCGNTGFRGRLAVTEVMPVGEEIEHLTVTRAPASQIRKVAIADGMVPLRVDGLHKAAAGVTTMEEVVRVTV